MFPFKKIRLSKGIERWTANFDGAMLVEGASAFAFSPKPLTASAQIIAETDETKFSHKLPVVINGTTYYIMLTTT